MLKHEHVSNTIDYAEVSNVLERWVQEEKFQLIETLAERGCLLIFRLHAGAKGCD